MQEIYFDNAATTAVYESSAKVAYDIMTNEYGNPSSVHSLGFRAEMLLKTARRDLFSALGADERNYTLTFTASGTEADNLAVIGAA
ncbi:MAG: aminotransferase class V-fold PLP-dependent enzyme, partial [Clostridia bacterium]|nr:aminotransferase class V-fold PLP-dependent enzyme [Clostridia bacterium]